MEEYTRTTNQDRERILVLKQQGCSQKDIANEVGKNQSTISRELRKGLDGGAYNPMLAQRITEGRMLARVPDCKIDSSTWRVINNHLGLRWSPRQIAEFLHSEGNDGTIVPVSEKTIYNYIEFHMKGELKKLAVQELRQRGKVRKGNAEKRGKLPNMALIDERPKEVDSRIVPGHWEGDLIIGANHQSALSVIVERKTRYVTIDLLLSYDADSVRKSIEHRFKKLEPQLIKSITCDQGKEMAQHEQLSAKIKTKVYFCHPHSPWEKGTCENTNYLIRDMLDGVTDFRKLTKTQARRIATLLNQRPRQTLGFNTPEFEFMKLCAESC
jgi:transposase, IS30 family